METCVINTHTFQEFGDDTTVAVALARALRSLWKDCLRFFACGDRTWRVVVTRLGELPPHEVDTWAELLAGVEQDGGTRAATAIDKGGGIDLPASLHSASLLSWRKDLHLELYPLTVSESDLLEPSTSIILPATHHHDSHPRVHDGSPDDCSVVWSPGTAEQAVAMLHAVTPAVQPLEMYPAANRSLQQQRCSAQVALCLHHRTHTAAPAARPSSSLSTTSSSSSSQEMQLQQDCLSPGGGGAAAGKIGVGTVPRHALDSGDAVTVLAFLVRHMDSLSWLTSDLFSCQGRRSALPAHMTILSRLSARVACPAW